MPTIKNALDDFKTLQNYKYHFKVAHNKKISDFFLTFEDSDFYHIVGFQYLKDIDIPKSPTQLFTKINNGKINDTILSKSKFYTHIEDSSANVKERIYGAQFLKTYLESNNIIVKYIKNKNPYSKIQADFFIKSMVNNQEVLIFIRERQNGEYCICSFFINPCSQYAGIKAYWRFKSRININTNDEYILLNKD